MRILQKIRDKLAIGWRISHLIGLMKPIQNEKIVFNNFLGKGYGDDPKYICEALRKIRSDLDLVWLTDPQKNREQLDLPAEVRCVAYGSRQALYELTTAHIWISNVKNSIKPPNVPDSFICKPGTLFWESNKMSRPWNKNCPRNMCYPPKETLP